jgi:hypothetical protein
MLVPWFESSDYRGCPFQNIVAEAPPDDPRVRAVVRQHREHMRALLMELTCDLMAAEPSLAGLHADRLVDTYMTLFEGAIALSVAYREPWPVHTAIEAMNGYLGGR